MQNFREYNEILSIMKKLIDQGLIKITKDSFTIQNLKNILLSFPQFEQEINSLKEKLKFQNDKNSNWFFMLKLLNKKKRQKCPSFNKQHRIKFSSNDE